MSNRCPSCGHENVSGALICEKCYSLLVKADASQPSTTLLQDETGAVIVPQDSWERAPTNTVDEGRKGPQRADSIALYVGEQQAPLVLQIGSQAILGRYTPNSVSQPRVDLTPYGAFDKGVSRMHVILRRLSDGVMAVEDMASSNGTWLNGRRLQPYIASPLRSGDRLRLGQLEMEVQLGGEMGNGKSM